MSSTITSVVTRTTPAVSTAAAALVAAGTVASDGVAPGVAAGTASSGVAVAGAVWVACGTVSSNWTCFGAPAAAGASGFGTVVHLPLRIVEPQGEREAEPQEDANVVSHANDSGSGRERDRNRLHARDDSGEMRLRVSQAPRRLPWVSMASMRVLRARGIEAAARPDQRAECELIRADQDFQDVAHVLATRCQRVARLARSAAAGASRAGFFAATTMSTAGSSCCARRKDSRTRRRGAVARHATAGGLDGNRQAEPGMIETVGFDSKSEETVVDALAGRIDRIELQLAAQAQFGAEAQSSLGGLHGRPRAMRVPTTERSSCVPSRDGVRGPSGHPSSSCGREIRWRVCA